MRYAKKRKRLIGKSILVTGLFFLGCFTRTLSTFLAVYFPHNNFFQSDSFQLVFLAAALAVLYRPLDRLSHTITRWILVVPGHDYVREIESLTQHLSNDLTLKELGYLMVNTLSDVLGARVVSLMVLDRRFGRYSALSSCGLRASEISKLHLSDDHLIVRLARQEGGPMLRDELIMHFSWQEANVIVNEFQQLRAALILPLFYQGQMVGLCSLSLKAKGKLYSSDDIKLFKDFALRLGHVVGQALQVYELELANAELKDQQSTLLQTSKLAAIEQLASGFAHQIHNPLTIISGKAQVLLLRKDKHSLGEEVVRVLQSIVKETRRAAEITQKLVAFSRLRKPVQEPIHFEQVVTDTLSLISYRASLDSIKVVRHVAEELPPFVATVPEFREIFLNLFMNAIDAMEGGGVLFVKIKGKSCPSEIEIKISDSGKGIPESELPHLFDPFFTTRHDRAGLGLFVVQKIVHHYGGTIRVESKENKGTLFTIRLPVKEAAVATETSTVQPADHLKAITSREEVHEYAQDTGGG